MKKRYAFTFKNWFLCGLTAAISTGFSLNLQAQAPPAILWDKTIGGNQDDFFPIIKQTSDGGYILAGTSQSGISGDKSQGVNGYNDYWIIKLDGNGNKLWDKTYGGSNTEELSDLKQTSDGGYILAGTSLSPLGGDKSEPSRGSFDYWVVKLDASGNKVWDKTFGGSQAEKLNTIRQTLDGGYILGGLSYSGISGDKTQATRGNSDFWLIKTDGNGIKVWDKTFGGAAEDELWTVEQTANGDYLLGGFSYSGISGEKTQPNKGDRDCWIIRTDNSGNKLWDNSFGGTSQEILFTFKQTPDGGYILGGYSQSGISGDKSQVNFGDWDFWVLKLDSNRNKTWDKTFGGTGRETLHSVQIQPAGNGYTLTGVSSSPLSGNKSSPSNGSSDYWMVHIDNIGNKLWEKAIGGNGADEFWAYEPTADGGSILSGYSWSGISFDKTQSSKGGADYWIVKLAPSVTGEKETKNDSNLSIFPIPNQGKFNIQLNTLTPNKTEITISDLLGRVVLQKEFQTPTNQLSEEITLPNAKGIYLLQLKTGNQISTHKIAVE